MTLILQLIQEDDPDERRRLESILNVAQVDIVNHYIDMSAFVGDPVSIRRGSDEEKLAAVRKFIQGRDGVE